jgi:hypothetical protein
LQLIPKLSKESFEVCVIHPNGGYAVPALCDVYFYVLDRIRLSSFPVIKVSGCDKRSQFK